MSERTLGAPIVEIEDVFKSFGRVDVLNGVSLTVRQQEVACLIGPSGSGKSTLLRCVNHLEKIDAGRISVGGKLVGYHERKGRLHEMHDKDVALPAPVHRHGVPAVQPVPAHDRAGERDRGAGPGAQAGRRPRPASRRGSSWRRSDWPTRPAATPASCPGGSSSAWRSPARWP